MTRRCYLAHPVSEYGGERQRQAIAAIEAVFSSVENPDCHYHQQGYKALGMQHFIEVVESCDAFAFMRFRSGEIGAGVAKEIAAAIENGLPIFDVSDGSLQAFEGMPSPVLTVEETRAKLQEEKATNHSLTPKT